MNPKITFEVDPHEVLVLTKGLPVKAGGIRRKTTVYIVQEGDIAESLGGPKATVMTIAVPPHAYIELRIVE